MTDMDDGGFELLLNLQSLTDEELRELADRLAADEKEISKRRRLLHAQIDILRAELVRRLKAKHDEGAALVKDGDISMLVDILSGKTRKSSTGTEGS